MDSAKSDSMDSMGFHGLRGPGPYHPLFQKGGISTLFQWNRGPWEFHSFYEKEWNSTKKEWDGFPRPGSEKEWNPHKKSGIPLFLGLRTLKEWNSEQKSGFSGKRVESRVGYWTLFPFVDITIVGFQTIEWDSGKRVEERVEERVEKRVEFH